MNTMINFKKNTNKFAIAAAIFAALTVSAVPAHADHFEQLPGHIEIQSVWVPGYTVYNPITNNYEVHEGHFENRSVVVPGPVIRVPDVIVYPS